MLFGVHTRPPPPQAALAALAHLLAIVASIATAPLLIAGGLGLDAQLTVYVIAAALAVSGVATLVQCIGIGPVGSRLLSIQGTSFAFIGAFILGGQMLSERSAAETVGVLLGSAGAAALITVVAGFYIQKLSRVLTPTVAGITIVLLGLALVHSAGSNAYAAWQRSLDAGAGVWQVPLQAAVVVALILSLSLLGNAWLRLSAIFIGLVVGTAVAAVTTGVQPPAEGAVMLVPSLLPFPLGFDIWVFALLLPIFLVTIAESVGDLTATSALSGFEPGSPEYWQQVRGGVMADGVNTVLAAFAGTFPNTTFSQNNGVIRMNGVASRYVGALVGALLIVLGLLPIVAAWFQAIPGGVLHAATGVLFAMIAWTGWQLLQSQPDPKRAVRHLLIAGGLALALMFVPDLSAAIGLPMPGAAALLLGFPVASGAVIALLLELRTHD